MDIRRLQSGDWAAMKELRLKALKENPEAFSRTYADELAFPDEVWIDRTASASEGKERICYLCFEGDEAVGMGGSSKHKQKSGTAVINGVWVDPRRRGTDAARSLLDSLTGWASAIGMRTVEGYVTQNNGRALAFYRKCGFEITEETIALERDPSVVSALIRKKLDFIPSSQATPRSASE